MSLDAYVEQVRKSVKNGTLLSIVFEGSGLTVSGRIHWEDDSAGHSVPLSWDEAQAIIVTGNFFYRVGDKLQQVFFDAKSRHQIEYVCCMIASFLSAPADLRPKEIKTGFKF